MQTRGLTGIASIAAGAAHALAAPVVPPPGSTAIPTSTPTATPIGTPTPIASQNHDAVAYQANPAHDGAVQSGALVPPLQRQWSVDLGGAVGYPLIAQGRVYVTVHSPAGVQPQVQSLYALDATTGATVWGPVKLGLNGLWATYDNGRVFAVSADGMVWAVDALTGALIWSEHWPAQYAYTGAPTAVQGVLYLNISDQSPMYAIDERSGDLVWTAQYGVSWSSPAVSPDSVFLAPNCGFIFKVDRLTGALSWGPQGQGCSGFATTPVYYRGRVYVRDTSGLSQGFIFDALTLAIVGRFDAQPLPAFLGSSGFFLHAGHLEARDLLATSVLWSFAGDGTLSTAPMVVNQQVYVGGTSGNLYSLDALSGQLLWTTNVGVPLGGPDGWGMLPAMAAGDGLLVVPAASQLSGYIAQVGPTPTATATITATPTVTPSPTGTPTSTPIVGGKSFKLGIGSSVPVQLSWTGGVAQDSYVAMRIDAATGTASFLPPGVLPASATSVSDTGPLKVGDFYCYAVLPYRAGVAIGISDYECIVWGTRTATGFPTSFAAQLNQSASAALTWGPSGAGEDGYLLLAYPMNGSPPRWRLFASGTSSAIDITAGVGTCYVLVAMQNGTALGSSDWLCAIPGVSTLGSNAAPARLSPAQVQTRLRQAVPSQVAVPGTRRSAP
jgi:outer membrane protein assembly factor BamB